jgi:hypothetical protein
MSLSISLTALEFHLDSRFSDFASFRVHLLMIDSPQNPNTRLLFRPCTKPMILRPHSQCNAEAISF